MNILRIIFSISIIAINAPLKNRIQLAKNLQSCSTYQGLENIKHGLLAVAKYDAILDALHTHNLINNNDQSTFIKLQKLATDAMRFSINNPVSAPAIYADRLLESKEDEQLDQFPGHVIMDYHAVVRKIYSPTVKLIRSIIETNNDDLINDQLETIVKYINHNNNNIMLTDATLENIANIYNQANN